MVFIACIDFSGEGKCTILVNDGPMDVASDAYFLYDYQDIYSLVSDAVTFREEVDVLDLHNANAGLLAIHVRDDRVSGVTVTFRSDQTRYILILETILEESMDAFHDSMQSIYDLSN